MARDLEDSWLGQTTKYDGLPHVGCVHTKEVPTLSPRVWTVAFLEGFSTLAVEVIAIRLATPVVGSSMTLTGVMLGVVLFALSAGYWRGGELSSRWDAPGPEKP